MFSHNAHSFVDFRSHNDITDSHFSKDFSFQELEARLQLVRSPFLSMVICPPGILLLTRPHPFPPETPVFSTPSRSSKFRTLLCRHPLSHDLEPPAIRTAEQTFDKLTVSFRLLSRF